MLQGEKIPFQTHGTALEKEATLGKEAISTPGSPCVMVGCPWAMFRRSTSDNGIGTNCMPDLNNSLPRNSKLVHIHCSFNTQYLWNSNGRCHTPTVSENNPQIRVSEESVHAVGAGSTPLSNIVKQSPTPSWNSTMEHPPKNKPTLRNFTRAQYEVLMDEAERTNQYREKTEDSLYVNIKRQLLKK